MTAELTGVTRFTLFAPWAMLAEYGCPESHLRRLDPACRGCAVSAHVHDVIERGALEFAVENVNVHPEWTCGGLQYSGSYADDVGRLAVARLIAWLRGDRDPLDLAAEGLR